jgi:hypothetical protein
MNERDRAARRRLVWLLLTRGDLGAEALRSDGLAALRSPGGAHRLHARRSGGRQPPPDDGALAGRGTTSAGDDL